MTWGWGRTMGGEEGLPSCLQLSMLFVNPDWLARDRGTELSPRA